jgi:hypothetical protein
MLKTIDQRLADLQKAGFKVTKYREIKSGTQYKMLSPKVVRKLWPVIVIRDSLEEAVAYTEGVADMWEAVQLKINRSLSALSEDFGVKGDAHEVRCFSPSPENQRRLKAEVKSLKSKLGIK